MIIAFLLGDDRQSMAAQVVRHWIHRRLQLVLSGVLLEEYREVAVRFRVPARRSSTRISERSAFFTRLTNRDTVSQVHLGVIPRVCRDPDDDMILATAITGKAQYVVTLDRDLLDLSPALKRRLKFNLVTPALWLNAVELGKSPIHVP